MPQIKYVDHTFQEKSLALLRRANDIIADYHRRGYDLTLRQLYYQLVSRDIIANTQKEYKKLGNLISNARDAGLVDWNAITDRTRNRVGLPAWDDPKDFLKNVIPQFRINKWEGQKHRVFVWVEKEALAGVLSRACSDEGVQVAHLSCRGYMSSSTIWEEARNLRRCHRSGQYPVVIHLGDHDPSGIDMTRDNYDRLALYSELTPGKEFLLRRIALNWDQVEQYNPPPNPAKLTDSRANGYIEEYGPESWELDALDPDVLVRMIQATINEYRDMKTWRKMQTTETGQRDGLRHLAGAYDQIVEDYAGDEEE